MLQRPKYDLDSLQKQGIVVLNDHHPHAKFPVSTVGRIEVQTDEQGNPRVFAHHAYEHNFPPQHAMEDCVFPLVDLANMMDCVSQSIVNNDDSYLEKAERYVRSLENMDYTSKLTEIVNTDVISSAQSVYEHSLFELGLVDKAMRSLGYKEKELRLLNPSKGTVKRYYDRFINQRFHPDIILTKPPGDYTMSKYSTIIDQLVAEIGYKGYVYVEQEKDLSKDFFYYTGLDSSVAELQSLHYLSLEINPYNIQSKGLVMPSMEMYNWGYVVTYLRDGYIQTQRYSHSPAANRYLPDIVDDRLKFSHFFRDRFYNGIMNILCSANLFLEHFRPTFETSTTDIVDISVAQVDSLTTMQYEIRKQVRTVIRGKQIINGELCDVIVDHDGPESYPNRVSDLVSLAMGMDDVTLVQFTKVMSTSPSKYNMIYNPAVTGLVHYGSDVVEHVYRVFDCVESSLFVYAKCLQCKQDYEEPILCAKCNTRCMLQAWHYDPALKIGKHPVTTTSIPKRLQDRIIANSLHIYRALVPKAYPTKSPPEFFLKIDGKYIPRRPGEYIHVRDNLVGQMLDRKYHSKIDGLTTYCMQSNHTFPDSFLGVNEKGDSCAVARMPSHRLAFGMTLLDVARSTTGKIGYLWQNTLGTKIFNFSSSDLSNTKDNVIPEMVDLNLQDQVLNVPGLSKTMIAMIEREDLEH